MPPNSGGLAFSVGSAGIATWSAARPELSAARIGQKLCPELFLVVRLHADGCAILLGTTVQRPWKDSIPLQVPTNNGYHGFKVVQNGFRHHPQYLQVLRLASRFLAFATRQLAVDALHGGSEDPAGGFHPHRGARPHAARLHGGQPQDEGDIGRRSGFNRAP